MESNIDLTKYGYTPVIDNFNLMPARVTAVQRDRYELITEKGYVFGRLKSSIYYGNSKIENVDYITREFPTVGDFVLIDYNESGDSIISRTLKRKTFFERKDPYSKLHKSEESDKSQAVCANFDYVFILSSLNYDLNIPRIERYLTIAYESNAIPVIILTKKDLKEDVENEINEVRKVAGDAEIITVSSKTREGLEYVYEYLKPRKTIVFLGSSGVGKSSLVNALAKKELMKVNSIREDDSKGRHTTTHRQMLFLDNDVMIIDTPGMRELGMWSVTNGLSESFKDVEYFASKCKFRNCSHENEPGCAVRAALESGELPMNRYKNYLKLQKENKYSNSREDYNKSMKEFGKKISKINKQNKKMKSY